MLIGACNPFCTAGVNGNAKKETKSIDNSQEPHREVLEGAGIIEGLV